MRWIRQGTRCTPQTKCHKQGLEEWEWEGKEEWEEEKEEWEAKEAQEKEEE